MSHTNEPWKATDGTPIVIYGDDLRGLAHVVGKSFGKDESELAKANARRIIACVNACENISTEDLEGGVLARCAKFIVDQQK